MLLLWRVADQTGIVLAITLLISAQTRNVCVLEALCSAAER
jgi:hypothetical protein